MRHNLHIDPAGSVAWAAAHSAWGRVVETRADPHDLRELFGRYEDLITDQVLSVLDRIENDIAAHGLCVTSPESED